jgi:hypothetical protein
MIAHCPHSIAPRAPPNWIPSWQKYVDKLAIWWVRRGPCLDFRKKREVATAPSSNLASPLAATPVIRSLALVLILKSAISKGVLDPSRPRHHIWSCSASSCASCSASVSRVSMRCVAQQGDLAPDGPSREKPQWRWVTWGSAVVAAHFGGYNKKYGSLGAVIGFIRHRTAEG